MTLKGGRVFDPFRGRGIEPFVAKVTDRPSLGIDLNPVVWVFAKVKTDSERNFEILLRKLNDVQNKYSQKTPLQQMNFRCGREVAKCLLFQKPPGESSLGLRIKR